MPRRTSAQRRPTAFKWRTPPLRTRGPRAIQRSLLEVKDTNPENIPRPESYLGTRVDGPSLRRVLANINEPEWRIFWSLVTFGLLPDEPEGFEYQGSVGGGHRAGGTAPDFLMPGLDLVFYMQGIHFHYTSTLKEGLDALTFARLASQGLFPIAIDENDAMTRPRAVTAAGLRYEDWSRAIRS